MIPIWVVFIIIGAFLVRDIIEQSKPTDFQSGYKSALRDISKQWNKSAQKSLEPRIFANEIRAYLQQQIEDYGVKGL